MNRRVSLIASILGYGCVLLGGCVGSTMSATSTGVEKGQTSNLENGKMADQQQGNPLETPAETTIPANTAVATLGAGCFWCVEAVFQQLDGVIEVQSGYAGGHVSQPTYREVCLGTTGHAEVCQITYDPKKISFESLLEVFWKSHDPTTPNQQGNDIGPQYRSVVFYHDDEQRELAEKYKQKLNAAGAFESPIVTEISPYTNFFPAEDYHRNYFRENPNEGYCRVVIRPKVEKVRAVFADKLKPSP